MDVSKYLFLNDHDFLLAAHFKKSQESEYHKTPGSFLFQKIPKREGAISIEEPPKFLHSGFHLAFFRDGCGDPLPGIVHILRKILGEIFYFALMLCQKIPP
jgi:hypothetical protein